MGRCWAKGASSLPLSRLADDPAACQPCPPPIPHALDPSQASLQCSVDAVCTLSASEERCVATVRTLASARRPSLQHVPNASIPLSTLATPCAWPAPIITTWAVCTSRPLVLVGQLFENQCEDQVKQGVFHQEDSVLHAPAPVCPAPAPLLRRASLPYVGALGHPCFRAPQSSHLRSSLLTLAGVPARRIWVHHHLLVAKLHGLAGLCVLLLSILSYLSCCEGAAQCIAYA